MRAKLKFSPNCCARAVWLAVLLSLIGCGEEPNPAVELARQLREGDAKDRYKAAKALEDHGSSASVAIPELTVALSDENAKLRYRAVKVLSKIDDLPPSVVAPLADLLSSDDEQTRYYAAKALANTDDAVEPKLSVLIDAMKGDNPTKTQFYPVFSLSF